jgi:bifunctional ADP-heptose synthase (sugar kinase/adenylyltransferase)
MTFDTRHKLLSVDQARTLTGPAIVFVTHLEVLQASHVQRLEELAAEERGKLIVIVTDPESPLVPLEARADVVAALRMVDYVIPSPDGPAPALTALRSGTVVKEVIEDEEEDRGRTRKLIEHVRSRSGI